MAGFMSIPSMFMLQYANTIYVLGYKVSSVHVFAERQMLSDPLHCLYSMLIMENQLAGFMSIHSSCTLSAWAIQLYHTHLEQCV